VSDAQPRTRSNYDSEMLPRTQSPSTKELGYSPQGVLKRNNALLSGEQRNMGIGSLWLSKVARSLAVEAETYQLSCRYPYVPCNWV